MRLCPNLRNYPKFAAECAWRHHGCIGYLGSTTVPSLANLVRNARTFQGKAVSWTELHLNLCHLFYYQPLWSLC
jgi:hypothetical protein